MSVFAWLKHTAARLDAVVAGVENHDGLAESAIRTARDRLARARRALGDAGEEKTRIAEAIERKRAHEATARERARTEPDERVALDMLRRARRFRAEATELEHQRAAFDETTERLESEVARIEQRLVSLDRARRLLRAREERAEALSAVVGDAEDEGLRGAIERWERQIWNTETAGQAAYDVSRLCTDPTDDHDDLLAELAEIRRNEP